MSSFSLSFFPHFYLSGFNSCSVQNSRAVCFLAAPKKCALHSFSLSFFSLSLSLGEFFASLAVKWHTSYKRARKQRDSRDLFRPLALIWLWRARLEFELSRALHLSLYQQQHQHHRRRLYIKTALGAWINASAAAEWDLCAVCCVCVTVLKVREKKVCARNLSLSSSDAIGQQIRKQAKANEPTSENLNPFRFIGGRLSERLVRYEQSEQANELKSDTKKSREKSYWNDGHLLHSLD